MKRTNVFAVRNWEWDTINSVWWRGHAQTGIVLGWLSSEDEDDQWSACVVMSATPDTILDGSYHTSGWNPLYPDTTNCDILDCMSIVDTQLLLNGWVL